MGLTNDIAQATHELHAAGVPSPENDAWHIAAHLMGVSLGEAKAQALLAAPTPARFTELVRERAARVPLQHLLGVAHFGGVELHVGPGVFCPRPETESLLEWAVSASSELTAASKEFTVVDLCTGSGAIAVAMATAIPDARIYAVELDPFAAAWAERNTQDTTVELVQADATTWRPSSLCGHVDMVLTNPPYIPDDSVPTEPEVREHDPAMALYGLGQDGLQVPYAVIETAAQLLRAGGVLALEHADVQQEKLVQYLSNTGEWRNVQGHNDLVGRPRFVTAQKQQPGQ